jgi:hypothetical protein
MDALILQSPVYSASYPFGSGVVANAIGEADECRTNGGRGEHAFPLNNLSDTALVREAKRKACKISLKSHLQTARDQASLPSSLPMHATMRRKPSRISMWENKRCPAVERVRFLMARHTAMQWASVWHEDARASSAVLVSGLANSLPHSSTRHKHLYVSARMTSCNKSQSERLHRKDKNRIDAG